MFKYATELEQYNKDLKEYKILKEIYIKERNYITELIEMYIKEITAFENIVPLQYQSKVWYKAYDDGHVDGWYSVYQKLNELIYLFEDDK